MVKYLFSMLQKISGLRFISQSGTHHNYVYILEVNVDYNSYRSYIINLLLLAFLLFCAASLHAC